MIRVSIDMWPKGESDNSYPLGEIRIANVGGDATVGNYAASLVGHPKKDGDPFIAHQSAVRDFPRNDLDVFDLLYRALRDMVGERNPDTTEPVTVEGVRHETEVELDH